jgi:GNAT superfamily N-acetyltransferase
MVREVRPDEYDVLGEITVAAYAALDGGVLDKDPAYVETLRDVAARAASALVLVAAEGDRVVGGVTYVGGPGPFAEFEGDDTAGIRMLAVAPEAQGTGAGSALVAACVTRARETGRRRIVLHTTPWMGTAHRLYERAGFVRAAELDWLPVPEIPLLGYVLDLVGRLDAGPGGETGSTRSA